MSACDRSLVLEAARKRIEDLEAEVYAVRGASMEWRKRAESGERDRRILVGALKPGLELLKHYGTCEQVDRMESALDNIEAEDLFVERIAVPKVNVLGDMPAGGPIPLNAAQERAVKEWAADDRLWTTQDTVRFNLRVFAREVLVRR